MLELDDSGEIVSISDLTFAWPGHAPVLDVASFQLKASESVFLRGPSGSGKSTLLGIIAGVLSPSSGNIQVFGNDLTHLAGTKRDQIRADRMGVIFQMFNLLPYLSVTDNVLLPLKFSKRRKASLNRNPTEEAHRLLDRLGLSGDGLLDRPVSDLSVGQQQRVAAARALIGSPSLIIADEPTSALDEDAKDKFIGLLKEECDRIDAALLFVSHDRTLETQFERRIDLNEINRVTEMAS